MTTYKDFKVTGDGEAKEISREEFIELMRSLVKSEDDTTIFGYVDSDGWMVLYQGRSEMRFRAETLQNLHSFLVSFVTEGKKP